MITPAIFEDRMLDIADREDFNSALYHAHQLMAETLEDLGYTAGIRVFDLMLREHRKEAGA